MLDPGTGATRTLRKATTIADNPAVSRYLTTPSFVKFPTTGGRFAFGLYYPPHNPDFAAPAGELPPLLVKCHGGPTSSTSSILDLQTQFWTSRGVAVMDVDHGGSSGYGRDFRNQLYRSWGLVDVDDCAAAVTYLADQGKADRHRAVITGGSAGGFTTLACLTFKDVFKAGGSLYGVSDLGGLVRDTHKFESRYLDWLIAPYTDADPVRQAAYRQVYQERSPLFHAEKISVPIVFFQGAEDRVVPPNQAELMVEALRKKGIPVGYLLFAGEQHGFRQASNIKRTLDAELYFFATLAFLCDLRFSLAAGLRPRRRGNEFLSYGQRPLSWDRITRHDVTRGAAANVVRQSRLGRFGPPGALDVNLHQNRVGASVDPWPFRASF